MKTIKYNIVIQRLCKTILVRNTNCKENFERFAPPWIFPDTPPFLADQGKARDCYTNTVVGSTPTVLLLFIGQLFVVFSSSKGEISSVASEACATLLHTATLYCTLQYCTTLHFTEKNSTVINHIIL